jgi:arylsulfatase A-like enzyme/Tfp pilus assembly protein PilF
VKKYLLYAVAITFLLYLAHRTFQRPKASEDSTPPAYNLILISIDTVRADYLQIYNSKGAPTPNLSKIANRAYLFTNVIAQVPFTLPSHSTMLTGTYPVKHRVQENIGVKLDESAITLAEVLKENGYQTAGFIGALVLESGTGIEQGFDTFDDAFVREDKVTEDRSGTQKDGVSVKRSFMNWLDHRQTNSPFFSFIHFYDPHTPYNPPAPFRPTENDPRALYRGELQYVDTIIGELVEDLSRRQLLNRTILVITSDHGEMLGEHGENGHGFYVYQEALRVPLLIALPDRSKGTSNEVLELVDLMPTVLDLLKIPVPKTVQGKSFAQHLTGKNSSSGFAYAESLTASLHFGAAPLLSMQDFRYKYIESPQPELYDLKEDAQELNNIAEKRKEIANKMKTALQEFLSKNKDDSAKPAEREISPEQQEQLAALGYIGGTSSADYRDSTLDAKECIESWKDLGILSDIVKYPPCTECLVLVDKIRKRGVLPVQARIFAARAYAGLKDYKNAISVLKGIVQENPKNAQAQLVLAHSLSQAGDPTSALRIYKQLMDEDSLLGLENYAELMIRLNRRQELHQTIEQFAAAHKVSEKHYPVLGEIYLLLQKPQEARLYLMKAMETSPENPYVYIHLSALADAEGKTGEAINLLEQRRGQFQTADYLMQLGRLYAKTGNAQKEHETFQEMVRAYPNDPRGYFFLGKIILQQRGDMRQVIQLAEKGLSLNPDPEFQPFGYFLIGDAYTALGDRAKAQTYLKKAEELRAREGSSH